MIVKGQENGSPFGAYINLLHPIFMFAIFMAIIHAANGSRLAKLCLIACTVASFSLAIIGNVKVEVINIFMAIFFGVMFLNLQIRIRYFLVGTVVCFVSVALIVPAIQLMRSSLSDIPVSQRLAAAWDIIEEADFDPATLARLQAAHFSAYQYVYAPNSSYVYPSTANIDRFMMIFPTDQVVRSLDKLSQVTWGDAIEETAELILPSFIISKDPEALVDLIAWDRGIRSEGSIGRPVLGLMAVSVALQGVVSVAIIPFLAVFPFLLIANYFFGSAINSPFGALGCFYMMNLGEKEFTRFLSMLVRELPLLWATCFLMLLLIHHTPRLFKILERSS
ncbi:MULTISPECIES: hypothetical protein [unclassified Aliiroseovarius]|uniref:hypothetical protein n=1 Tax=unclassified Aliiroseovarius TaxID=2623558 RepID=UPI00156A0BFC|nr:MULTISPECIES: hypothetical protein [unclassified Aliiroseovarius]NRP13439.1 hypothetical protein [Aliiroseovarius sp. xm-d-517]NRP40086.1 hypothetical protein [Aliiroseovarius sp. xm-m-339-2]NRP61092.1 hypothetical protein [Aliiroseovarius sp. xm-a-151]